MQKLQQVLLSVVLFVGTSACAMEPDELPAAVQERGEQAAQEAFGKARDLVGQVADSANNIPEAVKKFDEVVKQKLKEVQQTAVDKVEVLDPENTVSDESVALFGFEFDRSKLVMYGAGALAAFTVAGVTYVLYKNGTFQQWGTSIKNNPRRTLGVVTVAALVASVATFFPEKVAELSNYVSQLRA